VTAANAYMALGVDNAWDEASFKDRLGVRVTGPAATTGGGAAKASPPDAGDSLSFDLVGADAALANALRRVMLADAPTVAIEHVFIVNNTSIMPCEILAHRLGLVPLRLDPALLVPRSSATGVPAGQGCPPGAPPSGQPSPASEANTVVFKLHVKCVRQPDGSVTGDQVTSGDLEWLPGGSAMPGETGAGFEASQAGRFGPGGAAPVHRDILLVKLRPGQEVELEAHAVVGSGGVHAKWSPAATAWYRLHPEISLRAGAVVGEDADALAAELPGLVKVVGSGPGRSAAVAAPARGNERLLEKARRLAGEPRFGGALEVSRAKDHFIFTVESAGSLPPEVIVSRSLEILEAKCDRLLERL
jgi:DNA-directed RNA polymerases I and III subunit RPAC1